MNTQTASVVLHVSHHPEDLQRAVSAAEGLRKAQPDLQVRIIVNGLALEAVVQGSTPINAVEGVSIEACAIGLARRNVAIEELQDPVITTAAATVALVEAQQQGASYVRI